MSLATGHTAAEPASSDAVGTAFLASLAAA